MSKIKKLFYSVFMAFISIGVNSDIEARVTKEVAEATLPYLMEAAGIPGDAEDVEHAGEEKTTVKANAVWYAKSKIIAILDMIYTDEGQQQMVNWAINDVRPQILGGEGAPFARIWPAESSNIEQGNGERLFQILFPCKTGTFTSFSAHNSRLGYYALKYELVELIGATALNIGKKTKLIADLKVSKEKAVLENILTNLNKSTLDTSLAKIIFLLDICDGLDQLKTIYNNATSSVINIEASDIPTKYNEYECRPVPATMAQKKKNEGDCVENLCRHIIAIATQIDNAKYDCAQLPPSIRLNGRNFSGITEIQSHKVWADNLTETYLSSMTENFGIQERMIAFIKQATLPCFKLLLNEELKRITDSECLKISNGTFENITDVIESIAFYGENRLSERSKNPIQRFVEAMHKISNGQNKFEVSVLDKGSYPINAPTDTNCIIEIQENSVNPTLNRKVLLAFCDNGHAEIMSIQKN